MSNIISTTIDETFPIAGQDNSSQGFRDNFQSIKTALTVAKAEITTLENTAVFSGTTNDLTNTVLGNATVRNFNSPVYEITNTNNNFILYDCSIADNQIVTVTDSVSIFQMANVPSFTDTRSQTFKVTFIITNIDHYISFDPGAGWNTDSVVGIDSNGSLTFDEPGTYEFELVTIDGGSNFTVNDLTRNKRKSHDQFELWGDGSRVGRWYKNFNNEKGFYTSILEVDRVIANTFIGLESNDLSVDGDFTVAGNITGDWVIANTAIRGTIAVASATQPNITAVGTLTSLSVSGNVSMGTDGGATVNTFFGNTDICGVFMTQVATQSGTNFNVASTDNTIICSASGTITPNLPNGINDGQRFSFAFQNSVTVNFQSTGGATVTGLTGISAGVANGITIVYHNGRYYRI